MAIDSSVALECDVLAANPPPQIEWRRGNDEVVNEVMANNAVRFLDDGRYLFISNVQNENLATTYTCRVTNAFLDRTEIAPTSYRLVANLTEALVDYKQIGNLMAFVGDVNFEFAYVGGSVNGRTRNILFKRPLGSPSSANLEISSVANIARIPTIMEVGMFILSADLGENVVKNGTLTVYRKFQTLDIV